MVEPLSALDSLQALAKAYAEIPDPKIPEEERAVDLLWVFHLLGDMHQPCHCAQLFTANALPNGDRGANQIFIFGIQSQTSEARSDALHAFWDGLFNGKTNTQADILRLTASAKALAPVREIGPDPCRHHLAGSLVAGRHRDCRIHGLSAAAQRHCPSAKSTASGGRHASADRDDSFEPGPARTPTCSTPGKPANNRSSLRVCVWRPRSRSCTGAPRLSKRQTGGTRGSPRPRRRANRPATSPSTNPRRPRPGPVLPLPPKSPEPPSHSPLSTIGGRRRADRYLSSHTPERRSSATLRSSFSTSLTNSPSRIAVQRNSLPVKSTNSPVRPPPNPVASRSRRPSAHR